MYNLEVSTSCSAGFPSGDEQSPLPWKNLSPSASGLIYQGDITGKWGDSITIEKSAHAPRYHHSFPNAPQHGRSIQIAVTSTLTNSIPALLNNIQNCALKGQL